MSEIYLRFGEIPKDEQSTIHYRGYYCGKEKGTSVYNYVSINDRIRIILPSPCSEGALNTLTDFLYYSTDKPVYLVTGTEVGTGHDNEPLLRNITIIQDITEKFRKDIFVDDNERHTELLSLANKYMEGEKNNG